MHCMILLLLMLICDSLFSIKDYISTLFKENLTITSNVNHTYHILIYLIQIFEIPMFLYQFYWGFINVYKINLDANVRSVDFSLHYLQSGFQTKLWSKIVYFPSIFYKYCLRTLLIKHNLKPLSNTIASSTKKYICKKFEIFMKITDVYNEI